MSKGKEINMRDKIKSIESDHRETRNRRRKNIPTSVRCSQYRAPGHGGRAVAE